MANLPDGSYNSVRHRALDILWQVEGEFNHRNCCGYVVGQHFGMASDCTFVCRTKYVDEVRYFGWQVNIVSGGVVPITGLARSYVKIIPELGTWMLGNNEIPSP